MRYYTPNEVSVHNSGKDIWLSFLGRVYDLTSFIEANSGKNDSFVLKLVVTTN